MSTLRSAAAVVAIAFCATASMTLATARADPAAPVAKRDACRFTNLDMGDTGVGIISQNFEPAFDAYDASGAEDFACQASVSGLWQVEVRGQYYSAGGPARTFTVRIYTSSHGQADDTVAPFCVYEDRPYTDGTFGDAVIALDPAVDCRLDKGVTYWVEVQANMDFSVGGQWGWESTSIQGHTYTADWRNPLGGFSSACPTYQNNQDLRGCFGSFDYGPDLMVAVYGRAAHAS